MMPFSNQYQLTLLFGGFDILSKQISYKRQLHIEYIVISCRLKKCYENQPEHCQIKAPILLRFPHSSYWFDSNIKQCQMTLQVIQY